MTICYSCRTKQKQIENLTAELAQWQTSSITPDGYKAENERLTAELEECKARLKIEGDPPFPKDFDALDLAVERNKALLAENERLREALASIATCNESGPTCTYCLQIAKEALQE